MDIAIHYVSVTLYGFCRMILVNRKVPILALAYAYNRSQITVYGVHYHCTHLFCDELGDELTSLITHYDEIGSRAFRHFTRALFAYDIVKVMDSFSSVFL